MLFVKLFLLLILLGLLQNVVSNKTNIIERFCTENGISLEELEEEAKDSGLTIEQLIFTMDTRYSINAKHLDARNLPGIEQLKPTSNTEIEKTEQNNTIYEVPSEYEGVVGFAQSSSLSDLSEELRNESLEETDIEEKNQAEHSKTIDRKAFRSKEDKFSINKKLIEHNENVSNAVEDFSKVKGVVPRKSEDRKTVIRRVIVPIKKEAIIIKSNRSKRKDNRNRRKKYIIINEKGEREEYREVGNYSKSGYIKNRKYTELPKVIGKHLQPIIVSRQQLIPVPHPNIVQVPVPVQRIYPNHQFILPPQPIQQQKAIPPVNPPKEISDEFEDMNKREQYNKLKDRNIFIGPITIAIIVTILIIICIIGGFCFCGTKGMRGFPENAPPPITSNPPPPPYNSRTPLIPQPNQNPRYLHPPQSRQAVGYAIVPNVR